MADKNEDLTYVQYKYKIEWSYNCTADNKEYPLLSSQIHFMMIDKYIDSMNMPTLFISSNIDKNMLDKMIQGQDNDTIFLSLSKYNVDDPSGLVIECFKKRFIYLLNTDDTNYTKNYDYDNEEDKKRNDIFINATFGLLDYELVKNNQIMNYGVFNGSIVNGVRIDTFKMIDVVHRYTKHMKMIIEPMNNDKLDELPISPVNTVSQVLSQLDTFKTFYETPYRFFMDFDRTYLLSSAGNQVPAIGEDIMTIICNIIDAEVPEDQGIAIDEKNKCYVFNVNSKFTSYESNRTTNKTALNINTVTGVGELSDNNPLKNVNQNANVGVVSSPLIRVRNSNTQKTENLRTEIDNNQFKFLIKKAHIDIDALKINKEFFVNNHDSKSEFDGKFIISRLQEYYSFEEDEFVLMVSIYLKKIDKK